jgi:hypothetical protein
MDPVADLLSAHVPEWEEAVGWAGTACPSLARGFHPQAQAQQAQAHETDGYELGAGSAHGRAAAARSPRRTSASLRAALTWHG